MKSNISNLVLLYGLGLAAGLLIPVQAAANAVLAKLTGHVLYSTFILFGFGALLSLSFILIMRPELPSLSSLKNAPLYSYVGGFIVCIYVLAITYLIPKIGVANSIFLVVSAQIIMASVIDHFGLLGANQLSLNSAKLVGIGLMLIGLYLFNRAS